MRNPPREARNGWRNLIVTAAGIVALAALTVGLITAPRLRAQAPAAQSPVMAQWEIDAGGKMAFDAASVKPDLSGNLRTNVNLGALDSLLEGGLLSADVPVSWYIGFAYKLNGGQSLSLQPQLPKWATTDHFDIEARAEGNPTKDQMRLMMQLLLADRFKLVVHTETRQLLVFALVPSKPGKTGPQLQPHSDDPPCASLLPSAVFPFPCGVPTSTPSGGQWTMGARNLTMAQIADYLSGPGDLDRPVVDRTGLGGKFDFHIEFIRQPNGPDITPKADPSGPTFLEALRDQLGLKLESTTGPVDVLVIDHVEEPSPN